MFVDVVVLLVAGSVAGAAVSAALAVVSWRNRTVPGIRAFAWLMVAAVGWSLLNVAWLTATEPAVATTVFLLVRVVTGVVVGLWVVFALAYTGRDEWLTPARLTALVAAPSVYALLALTNPLHGLVTADVLAVTRNGMTLFVGRTGPVYTVQTVLQSGLIAAGYALFGEFLLRSRNLYRKQTFVILSAGLVTAGAHGLYVLGATPHPGVDVAPLTFALNGALVGVALLRYDFVSVAPLAGDLLVAELPGPVLALDDEDRVIKLLEDNGGRMKQVDIVETTEWSKSKVSMLLSDMEEAGDISKLRVGRENIISLAGEEPDAAGSPFDEE